MHAGWNLWRAPRAQGVQKWPKVSVLLNGNSLYSARQRMATSTLLFQIVSTWYHQVQWSNFERSQRSQIIGYVFGRDINIHQYNHIIILSIYGNGRIECNIETIYSIGMYIWYISILLDFRFGYCAAFSLLVIFNLWLTRFGHFQPLHRRPSCKKPALPGTPP